MALRSRKGAPHFPPIIVSHDNRGDADVCHAARPEGCAIPAAGAQVAAIVYPDNAFPGAVIEALVRLCRDRRIALAGVLQHQICSAPDRRCDVVLEDLTSGHRTAIFEDRGAGAAGCRLDEGALAEATARVEGNLSGGADLLVLNKFRQGRVRWRRRARSDGERARSRIPR